MATMEEIIKIDETTEMLFKDEDSWKEIVQINNNSFGWDVIDFARRWAKYMQVLINEGKSVIEIAQQASVAADFDGVTGYMYNCALQALIKCWKYGDELQKWHDMYDY